MLITLIMITSLIRWRVSGCNGVVWLTSTMVTCWGTMPVHHEILRKIAITSRLQHMIFYWLTSFGWLKRRSMSCLYSCSHTCEIIGWATMTFVHTPKDIVYYKRHCLLLILIFFAHVTTIRCSWRMYQQSASRQVDSNCQENGTDQHESKCIGTIFIHLVMSAKNALSIWCSWYMYHIATSRLLLQKNLDRSIRT